MYRNGKNLMGRRGFLTASAMSLVGYSAIIKAPQVLARQLPTDENSERLAALQPADNAGAIAGEKLMRSAVLKCDVLVAGGGLAGISAALSAARAGKKTVLVQDRSRLGGNASSEIKMHPLGVSSQWTGWREGGIIEELKLENAAHNPQLAWEMWDLILYDKCITEPNLTLLLDSCVFRVEKSGRKISAAWVRSDTTRNLYKIESEIFVDCTGDSRLAMEAGAEVMSGRDGSKKFGESLGDYDKVGTRQGSSLMITMRRHDKPMPFIPPKWAKKMSPELMKLKNIQGDGLYYGYWWIELGGVYDAIRDNEMLRFELLAIVMGVWDYIKNSGQYKDVENLALETIGMLPGRRDTYRIIGEKITTQHDIEGKWKNFDDAVAVGGWPMDDHPAEGFYATEKNPCQQVHNVPFYNIAFSSLYSKDFDNLMMAGRNISCSHVAFTSTRVMSTCAAIGQAVGTAAAMCAENKISPAKLRHTPALLKSLQQTLLRNDQTIVGIKNEDPDDLARCAKISASEATDGSAAENIISGVNLDSPKSNKNRWVAEAANKPWIRLDWASPKKVGQVRITFESGWGALSQTGSNYLLTTMIRGAQPMLAKDYDVIGITESGGEKLLARVSGNYQKLRVHNFDKVPLKGLKIAINSTNGSKKAYIKEVRVY